jgi:hypothetical protein
MFDLVARVSQKIDKIKLLRSHLEHYENERQKMAKEYDYFNELTQLENELNKNFDRIVENFKFLNTMNKQIMDRIQEDFVYIQVRHYGVCEFSFAKSQENQEIPKGIYHQRDTLSIENPFEIAKEAKEKKEIAEKQPEKRDNNSINLLGISIAQEAPINNIFISDTEQDQLTKYYDLNLPPNKAKLPPVEIHSPYLSSKPRPLNPENFDPLDVSSHTPPINSQKKQSTPKFIKEKSKKEKKDVELVT